MQRDIHTFTLSMCTSRPKGLATNSASPLVQLESPRKSQLPLLQSWEIRLLTSVVPPVWTFWGGEPRSARMLWNLSPI